MPRVVSLIASATEIVCALGCKEMLVGRSHECDYPETVKSLPICTEPKFNVEGSSFEIDQRVKAILQEGLSVYRVHTDRLRELKPDVIVTQTQCEVCAVSLRDVEESLGAWIDPTLKVVPLAPNALADVWADIWRVGEALHVDDATICRVIDSLPRRMSEIAGRACSFTEKPTVACIEWIDPLMAAGNWMPELVEMAGGINLFGEAGKHSPWMTWEQLVTSDPEIIVVLPCGFDIERTKRDMPILTEKPEWHSLHAVRTDRVFVTDGNQYFNRPGPRLVESLEILAEILHPGVFHFGHEGRGWQRFAG